MRGWLAGLLLAMVSVQAAEPVLAASPDASRLQVTDAYIELHTGPGRGFPVDFVVAREDWVWVELRHTDWFKVRTAAGKWGWVHREQLANTLTDAGVRQTFRDATLATYAERRLVLGASWGRFKSEPMLKLWSAYKLSETLRAEASLGQVQGVFSGTNFWHVNLQTEPWSDRRLSPFFGIGVGQLSNIPNTSLVGAVNTQAKLGHATLGAHWRMNPRFVARLDYSLYTAYLSDVRNGEYRALTAGLSFFF